MQRAIGRDRQLPQIPGKSHRRPPTKRWRSHPPRPVFQADSLGRGGEDLRAGSAEPSPQTPGTQARVLVLDDDPSLRRMIGLVLRSSGHEVMSAADGERGLEIAADWKPALVILDLRMPIVDGHEFLRRFRKDSRTPVVILSAHGARAAAQELGADAWMEKPFDPDRFGELVESLLARGDAPDPPSPESQS